ncbi:MAG: murein hydrolase activator EnvC family protein [Oleiphilus sp.]
MNPFRPTHLFTILHKLPSRFPILFGVCILITLCLPYQAAHSDESLENLSQAESEDRLDKLKAGIQKMTNWLLQANDEKAGLSQELKNSELKINRLSKQIRSGNSKIKDNQQTLETLKTKLSALESDLGKHKAFLSKQIQIAYFQEEHSQIKLLLNTDNPQDIARQMQYFEFIKDARKNKIDEVNQVLDKIKKTKQKIHDQTLALSKQTRARESQQHELIAAIKNKKVLLSKLEGTIKTNAQRLEKMRADQTRLKNLLNELEAKLANIPMPSDSAPFKQQKSKLPWPSHGKVIAEYGSSIAEGKLRLNGIRIASQENDPVSSIYSGRVIFSNWIRGFGLLIIVDHGDQFMSLYGNNKSLTKETGDWVRVGETIAFSSDHSNSQESGLYFEIRKNGKPVNPRHWLR